MTYGLAKRRGSSQRCLPWPSLVLFDACLPRFTKQWRPRAWQCASHTIATENIFVERARKLMTKDCLTADDAARVLKVSCRTMFRAIKEARSHDALLSQASRE